jgi:hypothetical protein
VDAVVTDPPYGLAFMGKRWDYDVPSVAIWAECLRVLKPGGHLLAFAGTRTQHRMAVRIEDAGFEIRDMIAWVYGSGFPKSLDVSKAIDKRGGNIPWQAEFAEHLRAIKPAGMRATEINAHVANGSKSNFWGHFIDTKCQPLLPTLEQYRKLRELLPIDPAWDQHFLPEAEREVVGQKTAGIANPEDRDRHTIGGSASVVVDITAPATPEAQQWAGWGTALKPALEPITMARKPLAGTVAANVLEHGTGALNVDGCRVEAEQGDEPLRWAHGRSMGFHGAEDRGRCEALTSPGRWPANLIHDGSDEVVGLFPQTTSGSKPGEVRRTKPHASGSMAGSLGGDGDLGAFYGDTGSAARFFYTSKASRDDRDPGNTHPTVKPTDLMRYLCRLVTPPSGIVLDPFMGSGSTGKAAMLEGLGFIGIEREAPSYAIAQHRISRAHAAGHQPDLFASAGPVA